MPVTVAQNPFIGPRPISKDEPIFGRDEEINRLTHLLLAERIVLLYSPSGAGKSSLIHAGLLRSLTEETEDDFYLPPTIGLSITASSAAPGPSLFSEAVIRSLERAGPANGSTGKIDSIEEYLRSHLKKSANGRCICLVFDQFEECVTFLPGQEAAKSAFFLDLARTLADPNVWALFAVREDFLAPIIDLGRVLPTRFKQAFRLDFLSKSRAQEVIQKTAHLGHYEFAAAALEQLVNDLAIVNVQGVDGTFSSSLCTSRLPADTLSKGYRKGQRRSKSGIWSVRQTEVRDRKAVSMTRSPPITKMSSPKSPKTTRHANGT